MSIIKTILRVFLVGTASYVIISFITHALGIDHQGSIRRSLMIAAIVVAAISRDDKNKG